MCGIVGLFLKSVELESQLGTHLSAMLVQMDDRGPDSAGVAVYRDPAPSGWTKLTLYSASPGMSSTELAGELAGVFGGADVTSTRAGHAVVVVDADAAESE